MAALRNPHPLTPSPNMGKGNQSRYWMLPKLHAQRCEYETHRPVWWKHVNLPGQIGELEREIEAIAAEIAKDQQRLNREYGRLAALRGEFSTDKLRHGQRIRERKEKILEIRARMGEMASEGKRLAELLMAHRERFKEGQEMGL